MQKCSLDLNFQKVEFELGSHQNQRKQLHGASERSHHPCIAEILIYAVKEGDDGYESNLLHLVPHCIV